MTPPEPTSTDTVPSGTGRTSRFARLPSLIVAAAALAGLVAYLVIYGPQLSRLSFTPHWPDLALLARQPFQIQLHIAAALTALLLGTVQLIGIKGSAAHRIIGWTWVVAMGTTAISSFFIQQINPGSFSLIHLLSGWTVVGLPMAVYAARKHRVLAHRRAMTGMFVGGLLVAGAFTFLPGRLMWALFFG
ncbi:DUF2306 domain-containing protein [Rhizobium sp. CRIBSB]|nr:DUF2306 domain-containing protein [Rhizobium sp. CRIBSB]